MKLSVSTDLAERFPGLQALACYVEGVEVTREKSELERFKLEVAEEIRSSYALETVKDAPIFRAYRDFYWRAGIDPTKTRPAGEALVRRILSGKVLPKINTLVDAYNLASARTGIAIGAFDLSKVRGKLLLRFANAGEEFKGIGMQKAEILEGNRPVVSDGEKLIAIYPYRDSDETKVTEATKDVLLLICGVPGISEEQLRKTAELTIELITRFCGGRGRA
jgi:DNA/RNA-binding domain of Phe-tRNA-synthetase-like protein